VVKGRKDGEEEEEVVVEEVEEEEEVEEVEGGAVVEHDEAMAMTYRTVSQKARLGNPFTKEEVVQWHS
jgi:hypothetical protein